MLAWNVWWWFVVRWAVACYARGGPCARCKYRTQQHQQRMPHEVQSASKWEESLWDTMRYYESLSDFQSSKMWSFYDIWDIRFVDRQTLPNDLRVNGCKNLRDWFLKLKEGTDETKLHEQSAKPETICFFGLCFASETEWQSLKGAPEMLSFRHHRKIASVTKLFSAIANEINARMQNVDFHSFHIFEVWVWAHHKSS